MLKNPVVVDNQERGRGPRSYGPKGPEGTARLENQARLAPLSKFDGRAAIRDLPRPRSKNPTVGGTGPDNLQILYRNQGLPRPRSKNPTVGGTGPDNLQIFYRNQGLQERNFVVSERRISELFTRYFNNKMTLLLFLVQAKKIKPSPKLVETVQGFLGDLFRHMLEDRLQKRHRLVFKWLNRFFEKLPDVSVYQRDKAKDFIRAIYDAFGLHLKNDI